MEVTGVKQSGFELPENYTWDAKLENGKWKKEGKVIVKDEKGRAFRVLQFKNDQLNGLCEFYDRGRLIEKRMFLNDKEEGWGCEINRGKETKWFLYSGGARVAELIKSEKMEGYWEAIDSHSKTISICKYDDNHKAIDKGYIFDNDSEQTTINRVVLFENGVESVTIKRFNGNEMIERDNNGNLVYEGGYADSIANDYPREGDGIEYDEGGIAYEGGFVNGKREGEGCSYKNGFVFYDGEWKEGQPDGEGWLTVGSEENEVYHGNWVMGKLKLDEGGIYDYVSEQIIPSQSQSKPIIITIVIEDEDQLRELLNDVDKKRSVKELVIAEGCGNEMNDDLELCGFENLESIEVKKDSLMNLNSLKISDNPILERIEIEDGKYKDNPTGAFLNVKSVTITSSLIID